MNGNKARLDAFCLIMLPSAGGMHKSRSESFEYLRSKEQAKSINRVFESLFGPKCEMKREALVDFTLGAYLSAHQFR